MSIPKKLQKFLDNNKIKYDLIKHRIVYTAFDKAQTLRIPQKIVGKTLVVKFNPIGKSAASYGAGKNYALVLIPANKNLDKGKFKKVAKVKNIDFVTENWVKKNLKGVKIGAVPPFGNLWKLSTFIDRSLMKQSKIIVNGGNWNWSIKISPTVFKKAISDFNIGSFSKSR